MIFGRQECLREEKSKWSLYLNLNLSGKFVLKFRGASTLITQVVRDYEFLWVYKELGL